MRDFLRFAVLTLPSPVKAGFAMCVVGCLAAIPLSGGLQWAALGVSWIGIALMWIWCAQMWARGRRAARQARESIAMEDFIDQSGEDLASDTLAVIASAINNGRPAAATAQITDAPSLIVSPDRSATIRFFEDVVTTTGDKNPAELRAMLVAAVDVAAQALFVVNAFDQERTSKCIRDMALAAKAQEDDDLDES